MTAPLNLSGQRIFIAGHRGMVGQALLRRLANAGAELQTANRQDLDLRDQAQVNAWFGKNKPSIVMMAAARVGGIHANSTFPADFIYDNMMIAANVIHAAAMNDVGKLLCLGSSCIYPKLAPQPIAETALLTGPLEPTNQWYAIAKIASIKLCQAYRQQHGCNFITAQPTNLYGPGDNFDLQSGHVLPALIRKAHAAKISGAKSVTVWGSGAPLREFLHVDDLADALVFLLCNYNSGDIVNIGSGEEVSIRELAGMICETAGFSGKLEFDATKPDGTPRKLIDVRKLTGLGWSRARKLRPGIKQTYAWFLEHAEAARGV